MLESATLPPELLAAIGSETRDFAVKSARSQPARTSLVLLVFSVVWLLFTSIFVVAFLGPLFVGKEVTFTSNGVETVAGPGNLGPVIVPALIIGFFVLVGLGMFSGAIISLVSKGGYFIGTPTRLIHFRKKSLRSIDWEQFSGDIEVRGKVTKGDITLGLRTGRMVRNKNGPERYVPDSFYISGIPEPYEIEKYCRKRIKENDPTPSSGSF